MRSDAGGAKSVTRSARRSLPFGLSSSLGPYELCCRIGAGGMGSVYLARDERQAGAHRFAAVKIIHPHLAEQQDFVAMFLDEADIASRLMHPNVVRAYDYGAYAETPYLAMEYLRGEPLTRVFQRLSEHASVEQHAAFVARV